MLRNIFFTASLLSMTTTAFCATINLSDVTSNLDGTIFFDDARTGGGDLTTQEGSSVTVQRFFDFDGNGIIAAPGTPGVVSIQSFGFATSAAADANDATEVDVTFIYLGQDENPGGVDDVLIGAERVNYAFNGAGEYVVDFDSDPSALIDGLGSRFRIVVTPIDVDSNLQETIRMKTRPANEQSFGHQGPTMSVSGTFTPLVPEPAGILLLAFTGCAMVAPRRR